MNLVTLFRQLNLFLTFCKACFLLFGQFGVTAGTAYAEHILGRKFVLFRDRKTATMALIINPFFQFMINRNAVIEHKTLTTPEAFFFRYFFQVFKNPALQVINLIKPLLLHVSGRFFTSY